MTEQNPKPVIHIIGLPHTIVSNEYSTCAFTGKVLRFSKMMRKFGWIIHEYSNEGSQSEANVHHVILTKNELDQFKKTAEKKQLYDKDVSNDVLISAFWNKAYDILQSTTNPGDIVCHVFGPREELCRKLPKCYHVESGIGYECTFYKLHYRIFESNAWMHWHYGRHSKSNENYTTGQNYHWVVPNYYDVNEWDVNLTPKNYILYFGRIIPSKGLNTIVEIAKKMPNERFILCGQGDASYWMSQSPNIEYHEPVFGRERSELVGNAKCMLMPTVYIEPFGGSGVEAQLCGTPLITTNYGCFKETVEDFKSGFLCNTLADWIESINRIKMIDRQYVADRARRLWSLETVGKQYDTVFNQLADLRNKGWYTEKSHKFTHYDSLDNGATVNTNDTL